MLAERPSPQAEALLLSGASRPSGMERYGCSYFDEKICGYFWKFVVNVRTLLIGLESPGNLSVLITHTIGEAEPILLKMPGQSVRSLNHVRESVNPSNVFHTNGY